MRDIKQLHPILQTKIAELQSLCQRNGIKIGISECLRTVAEQDALYAKGRTAGGKIVTNAKGNSYSSMHQWGVAFDFYLVMDVDGDGNIADDSYNNTTGLFARVGKLGQSIGLEWGGAWRSFVDLPHFQLPLWGSTADILKQLYRTPENFMRTWGEPVSVEKEKTEQGKDKKEPEDQKQTKAKKQTESQKEKAAPAIVAKNAVEPAAEKNEMYKKSYTTTAGLNLRSGAGTKKPIIITIPKGKKVNCYGYYTKVKNAVWLSVQYGKYAGFASKKYLK